MKKLLAFAAVAAMTVSLASCNKDKGPDSGKDGDQNTVKREWRITSMSDNWGGGYTFTYDAQGRVASVVSEGDNRVFEYEGNKLTIKNGGAIEYEMTLNADGFATEVKNAEHTWTITYDKNGYMVEGKMDGVKCTGQSVEEGNVLYWERYDSEHDFWRRKEATYFTKINAGCVQTHYSEDLKFSRWAWEARLFGNTSVNVMESCVWVNFGDEKAAKTAVYEYEYDSNGLITKECKYYGVWNETDLTGMDEDTQTTFTWEKIK